MTTIDIPFRNPCTLDVLIFPWVLKGVMLDRAVWRKIVDEFSIVDRPK